MAIAGESAFSVLFLLLLPLVDHRRIDLMLAGGLSRRFPGLDLSEDLPLELFGELPANIDIIFLPAFVIGIFRSISAVVNVEGEQAFRVLENDVNLTSVRDRCAVASIAPMTVETLMNISGQRHLVTVEDLIPDELYRQTIFQVYGPQLTKINISLTQQEIPATHPRAKKNQDFIAGKLGEQNYSLQIMDVARAFAEIMDTTPIKKANQH